MCMFNQDPNKHNVPLHHTDYVMPLGIIYSESSLLFDQGV